MRAKLPNVPAHRPRASNRCRATETQSRGSVQPVCSAISCSQCQKIIEHVNCRAQHQRETSSGRSASDTHNQWPNSMWSDHAGEEADAAQSDKGEKDVLKGELADAVAGG